MILALIPGWNSAGNKERLLFCMVIKIGPFSNLYIRKTTMSKKDKKIILVAQCLINPYCRVHVLGQNFPLSHELMDFLMKSRVGIIQYLCPETTAMGLQRNPHASAQHQ